MPDERPKTRAEPEISLLPTTLTAIDGELATLWNEAGQVGVPATKPPAGTVWPELQRVYDRISRLRDTVRASAARLNNLGEVITLRAAEANLHAAVVNSWPPATAAREILLLDAGLFGAGGAAYAAVGYPPLDLRIVPSFVLWGVGLVLILWGLNRLVQHDTKRWKYFEGTLDFPRN